MMRSLSSTTVRRAIVAALIVLWEALPRAGLVPELFLPSLSATIAAGWNEAGEYGHALLVTLYEVAIAMIIACGGDGTISEVANGIIESKQETELGILPGGTGSDFRRSLRMPSNTAAAARALRDGRTRTIDVARVSEDAATRAAVFTVASRIAAHSFDAKGAVS